MASPYRPYTPTKRTNTNNTPFRSGFQPKGVYRDRTDQLVAARRTRQEAKRLEEARLQKRLEKLIQLHFPHQPQNTTTTTSNNNLSQKLLAISSDLLAARPGSLRAHEQAIVRWQDDTSAGDCTLCHTPFGLRIRKHHCRLCGQLVCFKPHSAGPRRCSSLIRVDWDPLLHRNTIRVLDDDSHQTGLLPDRPGASIRHLIAAPLHNPSPSSSTTTPTKGVRVCAHCLAVVLRRQAMTCPPKPPEYLALYSSLKQVQEEIERAIGEFQEALAGAKHPGSTETPPGPSTPLKLLSIRRKLLSNLALFDQLSKKLVALGPADPGAEARLIAAIAARAGLFLRHHMGLIRSLGLLDSRPTPHPKPSSSPPTTTTTPDGPSQSPSHRRHLMTLSSASLADPADPNGSADTTHARLVNLSVLLEQELQIEAFLALARETRQLEDVASLSASLSDLRAEIAAVKTALA